MPTMTVVYPDARSYLCPRCKAEGINASSFVLGDDQWTQELVCECERHGTYIVPGVYPSYLEDAPRD